MLLTTSLFGSGCWANWTRPGQPNDASTEPPPSDSEQPSISNCSDLHDAPSEFAEIRRLDNPSTGSGDDNPSLTADLRQLFFRSRAGPQLGDGAVFHASRSNAALPFGPAVAVAELDDAAADRSPEVAADGLSIYWATDRRIGTLEIWTARRDDPEGTWMDLQPATGLEGVYARAPTVSADGLTMVFESNEREPSLGSAELYAVTRRASDLEWGEPQWLENVNSAHHDGAPALSADGRVLYFERDDGSGQLDIYRATRDSADSAFGAPEPVSEVNTMGDEESPFLSADCQQLFFTCDQGDGSDLCVATRPERP